MLCLKVARLQKIPRFLAFYSSVFSFYTPCRAPKPLGAPPSAASLPNGVTPTGASDAAIHKRLVSNPFVGQRTHRWKCGPATSPERSEARFGTKMLGIAGVVRPHQPLLTTATNCAISPVIRRSSHGAPVRSRLGDRQGTKGPRNQGTKEPRDQGTKGPRNQGTKEPRNQGTKEPRNQGAKARRHEGTKARRHEGTKARRHEDSPTPRLPVPDSSTFAEEIFNVDIQDDEVMLSLVSLFIAILIDQACDYINNKLLKDVTLSSHTSLDSYKVISLLIKLCLIETATLCMMSRYTNRSMVANLCMEAN